jgi:hypothetical protein
LTENPYKSLRVNPDLVQPCEFQVQTGAGGGGGGGGGGGAGGVAATDDESEREYRRLQFDAAYCFLAAGGDSHGP